MKDLHKIINETELPYVNKYENAVVAFVHAKGNSTRVISKNKRLLGDKPLFCHAIDNALLVEQIDVVVIDSDDDEILAIGKEHGAVPLKRPDILANNMATGDDLAYWQASNFPKSYISMQVIPTAPFLSKKSLCEVVKILKEDSKLDSVAGVYESALYKWKNGKPVYYTKDGLIPNSFELEKTVYETTGLYANHTEAILRTKKRLNPNNCKPYNLSLIESVDINTEEDFIFAQLLWKGMNSLQ